MSYATKPTLIQYKALQTAYDYFNEKLFDAELPPCLITLQRKKGARGYHWSDAYQNVGDADQQLDEIALNPACFDRCDKDIISTLVHEMCHLWQHHYGEESRSGYHNKEWANKMIAIGLIPVSLDNPGKMTGQKVTHTVDSDGRYDQAYNDLKTKGIINWVSSNLPTKVAKNRDKSVYVCPDCGAKVWGKANLSIICGDCEVPMEIKQ